MQTHKQAPPDVNFAGRLAALAHGAGEAARVCHTADAAGFEWPPARKADSEPPYELRAGTGRRGPEELWQRFDQAITRLSTMAAGTDMLEVARAYETPPYIRRRACERCPRTQPEFEKRVRGKARCR